MSPATTQPKTHILWHAETGPVAILNSRALMLRRVKQVRPLVQPVEETELTNGTRWGLSGVAGLAVRPQANGLTYVSPGQRPGSTGQRSHMP